MLPAMKLLANLERTTIKTLQFLAYILRIIVQIQVWREWQWFLQAEQFQQENKWFFGKILAWVRV